MIFTPPPPIYGTIYVKTWSINCIWFIQIQINRNNLINDMSGYIHSISTQIDQIFQIFFLILIIDTR